MVALITGAAQGIGKSIAQSLGKIGYKLVLADLNEEKLDATAAEFALLGFGVETFVGDLTDVTVRNLLRTQFPHIDILINNAGITNPFTAIENTTDADYEKIMAVNFKLPFLLLRDYLPHLKTLPAGWVINIASSANIEGYPGQSIYAASKAALSSLTDTVAKECNNIAGFKAITILPSRTDTAMNQLLRGTDSTPAQPPEFIGQVIADIISGKQLVNSGDDVRIRNGKVIVEERIGAHEF